MKIPLVVMLKDFFGFYVLTPFERKLLERLREGLDPAGRVALDYQLAHFTTTRRLLKDLDDPTAYGFTNFHTTRFGRDVTEQRQTKRFASSASEELLAWAQVSFNGGEITVQFWIARGVLFSIEYRSPQRIYYPAERYRIESISVWPEIEWKSRV